MQCRLHGLDSFHCCSVLSSAQRIGTQRAAARQHSTYSRSLAALAVRIRNGYHGTVPRLRTETMRSTASTAIAGGAASRVVRTDVFSRRHVLSRDTRLPQSPLRYNNEAELPLSKPSIHFWASTKSKVETNEKMRCAWGDSMKFQHSMHPASNVTSKQGKALVDVHLDTEPCH